MQTADWSVCWHHLLPPLLQLVLQLPLACQK
jgi:hypothetical protein